MEAQWQADRAALRDLLLTRPDLPLNEMAILLKRSYSWAKRWVKRLREAPPTDLAVLRSRCRARKTPLPDWDDEVLTRITELRLAPPKNLHRTPGPKTILYFLHRDPALQEQECVLPQAASTIWRLLHRLGLLSSKLVHEHQFEPPCEPLEEIQVDFKDVSGIAPDPMGKQQPIIEVCNMVDAGTSLLLFAQPHEDFHAQTALEAVIAFLRQYGCPDRMSFDHDPRWLGSPTGRDFPSALQRLLLCLGIEPRICPPHRPDRNAFVERYHRSYKYECLRVFRPTTLEEVCEVTTEFQRHYNDEHPHQGRACGNRPPREAFPTLPSLPPLPETVQADRWLFHLHQRVFARTVGADGRVAVNHETYYISASLKGHRVALAVDAAEGSFAVSDGTQPLCVLPIKGLVRGDLALEEFLALMQEEALSQERRRLAQLAARFRPSAWRLCSVARVARSRVASPRSFCSSQ